MPQSLLPYGRQEIDEDDIQAVVEVLRGPYLTTGPAVDAFEQALAETVEAPHAVACANGTAALHMAAMALDIGPGDVVIVPAMTFLATANAVAFAGGTVVFSDVDPDSGLMRPQDLETALERARTLGTPRAVFPVHLNGQCAPMAELAPIARRHGLAIVEDCCHAIGGDIPGPDGESAPVGSCAWSDMATFSFHPVKTVTMGEGGAVTTRDPKLAKRLQRLRTHGMVRDPAGFEGSDVPHDADGRVAPWYYEMQELGHNFRASDLQCALGLSQLKKLHRFVSRRRELVERYDAALADLAPLLRPIARRPDGTPGWHLYPVLIDFETLGVDRADLVRALQADGILTQVHYIPVVRQPYWQRTPNAQWSFPGADAYYARVLSLPLFPAMTDADVDRVATALRQQLSR